VTLKNRASKEEAPMTTEEWKAFKAGFMAGLTAPFRLLDDIFEWFMERI
jgi:hypothetical protein